VDSTYPYPAGIDPLVDVKITREGASEPEWSDSASGWIESDNNKSFHKSFPVSMNPKMCKVKYVGHQSVLAGLDIEQVFKEASERLRRQCSEDTPAQNVKDRFFDPRDTSLRIHLVSERFTNIDEEFIPTSINLCSSGEEGENNDVCEKFRNIQLEYKNLGINLLIVDEIYSCYLTNPFYQPPPLSQDCFTCETYPESGKCALADGIGQIPIIISIQSVDLAHTLLHELGHNCGLDHDNTTYNIMNISTLLNQRGDNINRDQANSFKKGLSVLFASESIND